MKRKTLYEGKFKRLVIQDGWEFVERVRCGGVVVVVAVTDDGKIVFVEQHRVPVGHSVIEFPAGLSQDLDMHADESLADAARRELLEETGYEAEDMVFLATGPVAQATSDDILTIFLAKGLRKVGPGGGDGTESIRVHEVPQKDVDRWFHEKEKEGVMVDTRVYAGLYLLGKSVRK